MSQQPAPRAWFQSIRDPQERYELDDNTLEVQQYSIHRDMTSWTASLGALIRDNRGAEEYGIIFALTLKEFPRVSIPLQLDPSGNR